MLVARDRDNANARTSWQKSVYMSLPGDHLNCIITICRLMNPCQHGAWDFFVTVALHVVFGTLLPWNSSRSRRPPPRFLARIYPRKIHLPRKRWASCGRQGHLEQDILTLMKLIMPKADVPLIEKV